MKSRRRGAGETRTEAKRSAVDETPRPKPRHLRGRLGSIEDIMPGSMRWILPHDEQVDAGDGS